MATSTALANRAERGSTRQAEPGWLGRVFQLLGNFVLEQDTFPTQTT